MRARDIIGKTIARIEQSIRVPSGGGRHASLDTIYFTDGTRLVLNVLEQDDAADYIVNAQYYSKPKVVVQTRSRA